jgi:hypothetical protein
MGGQRSKMIHNPAEVLRRMKAGDLPHFRGGTTYLSVFQSDGMLVSHAAMFRLLKRRQVFLALGAVTPGPWVLADT